MPDRDFFLKMASQCLALAERSTAPEIQQRMRALAWDYEMKARSCEQPPREAAE